MLGVRKMMERLETLKRVCEWCIMRGKVKGERAMNCLEGVQDVGSLLDMLQFKANVIFSLDPAAASDEADSAEEVEDASSAFAESGFSIGNNEFP